MVRSHRWPFLDCDVEPVCASVRRQGSRCSGAVRWAQNWEQRGPQRTRPSRLL